MSLRSEIRLIVPSEWGYGEEGKGDIIPPNSDLLFYVELLSIKDKEIEPPLVKKK
jgi:FKBP-type peptidyl-prolyl cis-trans isomerase